MRMSSNSDFPSVNIAGSGMISPGTYQTIRCAGAAKVSGEVTVEVVHVSGALQAGGSVSCSELRVSGGADVAQDLACDHGRVSGSLHVKGSLQVSQELHVSGSVHVGGRLSGHEFRGSGAVRVGEDVAMDTFTSSGSVDCPGLVSADRIHLAIHRRCQVGELAGGSIEVLRPSTATQGLNRIFNRSLAEPRLTVGEISADDVHVEMTHAATIRGDRIASVLDVALITSNIERP